MKHFILAFFIGLTFSAKTQTYFPPLVGNTWDTVSPQTLGWCTNRIDSLYQLLDSANTKAFIILKDGKIVIEKYFDTFTQDSPWYWASAGKTITSVLTGIAQQEGKLSINDSTSKYIGSGWTSCPPDKEGKITIRHQLTMSTGLDYLVPDWDCKLPSCLNYKADAGTQWFYHNATYLLLQDVLESATGLTLQQYTNQKIGLKIGMSGLWINGVYYSKPRSMARFGLMVLNKGIWNGDTLMKDTAYYRAMLNTSQSLNESYGYLWWLNGKSSYRLPASLQVFSGNLFPPAPDELLCGLGKNDQKLYIWPSQRIVIIRMGESADVSSPVPVAVDTLIWKELNRLICTPNTTLEPELVKQKAWSVYPNPAADKLFFNMHTQPKSFSLGLYDMSGRLVKTHFYTSNDSAYEGFFSLDGLRSGIYTLRLDSPHQVLLEKVVVVR